MSSRSPAPSLPICIAILAIVFAIMLGWTWGGWPDPIVDFGRELYVPWQLAQGKVLYRDIVYFNGPLSPYFNALIFKVFGPSLRTLELTNVSLLALFTAMLFTLLSRLFDRFTALVGCIVQLTIFSFIQLAGIGNYNFVTPYSHELTHGLILSVAMLLIMTKSRPPSTRTRGEGGGEGVFVRGATAEVSIEEPSPRPSPRVRGEGGMFLTGMLLGLIFLTKIEVFLAAAVVSIAYLALVLWITFNVQGACALGRMFLRGFVAFIAGALLPPLIAFALLRSAMPTSEAFVAVLGSWHYTFIPGLATNPFYRTILGSADLHANLLHIGWTFLLLLIVVAALWLVAVTIRPAARLPAVIMAWILATITYLMIDPQWWQSAFSGLPVMVITCIAVIIVGAIKQKDIRAAAQLPFAVFALVMLAKMFFAVRLAQYGFVLALPAMLVFVGLLLHELPRRLNAQGRDGGLLVQLCLPLIALIIAAHLRPYAQIFSRKPIAVAAGADRFVAGDVRGVAVNQCLAQLAQLPSNATVAVVPEGVMINFLSRRENPTKYANLMPPELLMFGESNILSDFQAHPPDYIVLNDGSKPTEYGYGTFVDYAGMLNAWITANYVAMSEPTVPPYPLRLLRHRPVPN